MKDKGTAKFDLKEFYEITDAGKEYLKLLQELQTMPFPRAVTPPEH